MRLSLLAACGLLPLLAGAQLSVLNGKVVLIAPNGMERTEQTIPSNATLRTIPQEKIHVTFNAFVAGEPAVPGQAMVRFEPLQTPEVLGSWDPTREVIGWAKVRQSGKGSFTYDLAKAPSKFFALSPTGSIKATLFQGSSGTPEPLALPLGIFHLPTAAVLPWPQGADSWPKHWEAEKWQKQEEIRWTDREPEKRTSSILSLLFTAAVLSPWVVLLGVVAHINPSFQAPTSAQSLFLALFVSFEGLIVAYWVGLNLLRTLPWFGALGGLLAFTGRKALSELRQKRLKSEGKKKE